MNQLVATEAVQHGRPFQYLAQGVDLHRYSSGVPPSSWPRPGAGMAEATIATRVMAAKSGNPTSPIKMPVDGAELFPRSREDGAMTMRPHVVPPR